MDAGVYAWIVIITFFLVFTAVRMSFVFSPEIPFRNAHNSCVAVSTIQPCVLFALSPILFFSAPLSSDVKFCANIQYWNCMEIQTVLF